MKEAIGEAHGRVNLIGEHTDYNGGWVLPTLIPQKTRVRLLSRMDQEVHAISKKNEGKNEGNFGKPGMYTLGAEQVTHTWLDYLQGTTKILRAEGFDLSGFEVEVHSTVPIGSGLSSSAALEVSFLKALRDLFQLKCSDIEIAKIGQRTENEFVGARVGIMDQMACSMACAGEALFLDTRTLAFERLRLPCEKMDLIVINSGLAHQHAGGDYNQRRSECEKACQLLGISMLRDLQPSVLSGIEVSPQVLEVLPPVLKRRARHVITENQRVHEAVKAIHLGDVVRLGQLFYQSHQSMAEDYEVSTPEIDLLVQLCREQSEVFGARLTGGGFGGSIVAIAAAGTGPEVAKRVVEAYQDKSGYQASVLVSSSESFI